MDMQHSGVGLKENMVWNVGYSGRNATNIMVHFVCPIQTNNYFFLVSLCRYGPLWMIIAAITALMSAIFYSLRKQEKRQRRWSQVGGVRIDNQNSTRRRSSTSLRASDRVKWQAFWYVGSFFITWTFLTIVRGIQTAGKGEFIPFWVMLIGVTMCPSQGVSISILYINARFSFCIIYSILDQFFNFLIYIRPRYDHYRERHPDIGRIATFFRVNPLFGICQCNRCCKCPQQPSYGGTVLGLSMISSTLRQSFRQSRRQSILRHPNENSVVLDVDKENNNMEEAETHTGKYAKTKGGGSLDSTKEQGSFADSGTNSPDEECADEPVDGDLT